jgi:signal transduction histidine kinase
MKKPILFLLTVYFLLPKALFSQNIDSLERKLDSVKGTEKVKLLIQLSKICNERSLYKMKEYGEKAIKEAREINNKDLEIQASYSLGKNYYIVAKYNEAISYLIYALKKAENSENSNYKILTLYLIGIVNRDIHNFNKAYEYFNTAAGEAFKANQLTDYFLSKNEIGNILMLEGKINEALEIKKKVLAEAKNKNEEFVILCCSHDIGLIYENLGDKKQALQYYLESNRIESIPQYPREIVIGYINTSRVYSELKEYNNAIFYAKKALTLIKKQNLRKELMTLKTELANTYAEQMDFVNAYNNLKEASLLKDSIFSEESTKQLYELQTKYETEKKENEIEFLKRDRDAQVYLRNLLILIIILVIIITIFIYLQLHLKRNNAKILESKNDQLKSLNKKLADSEKELFELNKTKDKFFSIISHDLRNPFVSMIGMSDLFIKDFNVFSDEEKLNMICKINSAIKYTHHLVENLLYWAGTQSGRIKANIEKIDLYELIDEILFLSSANANLKNIKLKSEIKNNDILFADRFMVETIFRNLISNSIKFTPSGGEVKITSSTVDNTLEIVVSDTGIGLNECQMNSLFKIDNQLKTKGTDGEQGSGIGLILCKEFVEKNNGTITVESTAGSGSKFILHFQLSESPTIKEKEAKNP